jgi:hypothetical protein
MNNITDMICTGKCIKHWYEIKNKGIDSIKIWKCTEFYKNLTLSDNINGRDIGLDKNPE